MSKALDIALPAAGTTRRRRNTGSGLPFYFLLTVPTLLVVLLVFGIPLGYAVNLSLNRVNMLTKKLVWVGLQNYAEILPNPDFLWALARTSYFALLTVLGGLALGMAMALVLNARFPGRNVLRSVVLIPWAMSPVAVGILWGWIFDGTHGTLNALLFDLGAIDRTIPWLANGWWAFHIVALVQVWNQAPLTCLLILAGLQSLPENLTSAARIDGAGPWQRFLKITLPWLRPMLLLVMILTTINSIMAFDLFWTMTKGGPGSATTVFSWMGYAYAFQFFRFGEGAAILFVLSLICMVLAVVYLRLFATTGGSKAAADAPVPPAEIATRRDAPKAGLLNLPAPARRKALLPAPARHALGKVGLALAALLIFVWSFAPFLWLVVMSLSPSADLVRTPPTLIPQSLTLENFRFVLFPGSVPGGQSSVQATRVPWSILNSLIVAACVTAVNLVLGTLAGYGYARAKHSRLMNGTLWALMITRMTPSLALILPFFVLFRTMGLLDTRTGLVIAYCSLILPLSTWMMRGYFENLPPNLERAARVDGCTRLQTIWRIVLPVARPGIVAAGIFCFLVSWNEFIFALILTGTLKAQTIPVIIAGFLVQLRFFDYGPMFAASVLAVIPPVVIALAFQRYLVRGMLAGSLKG